MMGHKLILRHIYGATDDGDLKGIEISVLIITFFRFLIRRKVLDTN